MAKSKNSILIQFTIAITVFTFFTAKAQRADFAEVNFSTADSIANAYKGASLNNLPLLSYRLTHTLHTQVQKFRAIYIWVCSNITADYYYNVKVFKKLKAFKYDAKARLEWNAKMQPQFFRKLLEDKETVCVGYAYLIKALSQLAGLNCEIVNGYGKTQERNVKHVDIPSHSWNAVELKGKWYIADATWASGYYDIETEKFIKNYNDGYFLANPELFSKNHYPLDKKWLLQDKTLTLEEFIKAPTVYHSIFKSNITPLTPKRFKTKVFKNNSLEFKFKLKESEIANDLTLILFKGFGSEEIKATEYLKTNNEVVFNCNFSKKGLYSVYVKYKNNVIAFYKVTVVNERKII